MRRSAIHARRAIHGECQFICQRQNSLRRKRRINRNLNVSAHSSIEQKLGLRDIGFGTIDENMISLALCQTCNSLIINRHFAPSSVGKDAASAIDRVKRGDRIPTVTFAAHVESVAFGGGIFSTSPSSASQYAFSSINPPDIMRSPTSKCEIYMARGIYQILFLQRECRS